MDDRIREAFAAARAAAALDREALAAQRRADVVRWVPEAEAAVRPEPWFAERDGPSRHRDAQAGLDADGRIVLFEVPTNPSWNEVWRHGPGWSECIRSDRAQRFVLEDGRPVVIANSGWEVEVWTYAGGVPVRGDVGTVLDEGLAAQCYVAEVEEGGLRSLSTRTEFLDWEGDDEEGLAHALAAARRLDPGTVVFDHRLHGPGARMRDGEELVALLVPALEHAVVAAVEGSGVADPFVVVVQVVNDDWPLTVRVGGEAFRRAMTELSPDHDAAVRSLHKATPPDGATIGLRELLGEDALFAYKELSLASRGDRDAAEREQARRASAAIDAALAERLNRREWPGASQPFLVLVRGREGDLPAFPAAFRESIRSRANALPPPPDAARTDRDALEAVLAGRGLEAHARRLAHETAQVGFKLQEGDGAGHLGGPALLPAGETWPAGLTFLAGIDTRAIDGLPDGWMLFFADPEEWVEDGEATRFYFTTDPVPADGPALRPRPVRAVPVLTLPDGWDLGRDLGLYPAEAEALEPVARWLRYPEGFSFDDPDHWVLGAVTDVQGYPLDDDHVLLLHLAWDPALGFEYLDGGALRFSIPRQALTAGDWSRVDAEASSS